MAVSHGFKRGMHKVVAELHQSRRVSPDSLVAAEAWPDRVFDLLAADTTLSAIDAMIVWPMVYKAGPMEYGKEVHYGVRFEIVVKVH